MGGDRRRLRRIKPEPAGAGHFTLKFVGGVGSAAPDRLAPMSAPSVPAAREPDHMWLTLEDAHGAAIPVPVRKLIELLLA